MLWSVFPKKPLENIGSLVFDALDGARRFMWQRQPDNPQVEELLQFIRQRNHLKLKVFQTSRTSIEAALVQYESGEPVALFLKTRATA